MKRILFVSFFALFLYACAAFSQVSGGLGAITGVVTDPSGAVVANAQVVIENQHIGIHHELTTTGGGLFNLPALVPAAGYQVTVTAPGFARFENRDITVHVGENVNVNAALQVQSATTQVQVEERGSVVDQEKIDVSQDVTQHEIDNLPINGRRVDQFVLMTPGVVPDSIYGDLSFRGLPGGNSFLLDGNDTTEQFYNENGGRTRIASNISQDAVQEFQVLSDAYTAEYGRAIGGVVNTVTRSGTNAFHGTGFWFFRNRTLDARDPFAPVNPSEVRNQFGGSVGGPIVRDKLFFFFNTEEQLRDFPLVSSIINGNAISGSGPTATWKGCGVASGAYPAATLLQCQAINQLLPGFFTTLPRTANQQTAFGKIDWRPNDKNSFSFSLNYQHYATPNGIQSVAVNTSAGAFNANGNDDVNVRNGRADWTYVPTGSIVNEARFGWFKDRQADQVNNALINPSYGTLTLTVNSVGIGFPYYLPRIEPSENRFEGADNLSWTVGKHSFKFGVDYSNTEDYYNLLFYGNGAYTYSNANAFALDFSGNTTGRRDYSFYEQAFGNPIVDTYLPEVDWYAQDQYRVRPNLTLYYGIRYEKNFLPQPPGQYVNSSYPQTGRIPQANLDFAPRVGFAWSFYGGKTVIRSGYGIYYGRYLGAMLNTLFTANNNYTETLSYNLSAPSTTTPAPVFPNVLATPTGTASAASSTIEFAAPDLRTPYTQQGDFSVAQQLGSNTSLTVSYMWDRGARFFAVRDLNLPDVPPTSVTYSIVNSAGATVGTYTTPIYLASERLHSNVLHLYEIDNGGNSYYNGLSVQLEHRYSHGFQAALAYTWSHAIDDNLQGVGNNEFYSGVSYTLYNGNYQGVKGNSLQDQRQRLVFNWIWSPTLSKSSSAFARFFLNNWQLATITTIATPLPVTETVNVQSNYPGIANTGYLTGFNGTTAVPFLGVNTLRLNDTTRVDARLTKILPFSEHFRTLLQFEAFNLTNTITYTSILATGYNANWTGSAAAGHGTLSPATGLGTPTASAGFPDGTNARRMQASLRFEF